MCRRVREFVEIGGHTSLDELIAQLHEIRDALPDAAEAEVKMRGDDVFGRKLSISYLRPQTTEEAECDARYAEAWRREREQQVERLQRELAAANAAPAYGGLRIVA